MQAPFSRAISEVYSYRPLAISDKSYVLQILKTIIREQSGAVEACWAHNPEVRGSKPRSAINFFFLCLIEMFEEMFALYFPPIRTGRKSMQLVPRVENARNQSHECFAFAPDLLKI